MHQVSHNLCRNLRTLYYWRQVTPEEVDTHSSPKAEDSSLRGVSRINKRAYNTMVSIIHDASYRAQLVHNEEVKEVETDEIIADEMWSFAKKSAPPAPRFPRRKAGASSRSDVIRQTRK